MIILLDVGNTSVTYGVSRNGSKLSSFGSNGYYFIPFYVKKCMKSGKHNNVNIVISSVVPKITSFLKKSLSALEAKVWVLRQNLPVAIPSRYQFPGQLGIDRVVNIYGGLKKYGPPFLMIDYGTAATFDYVSKSGVFEGGLILPGPQIAFESLTQKAALLPKKLRLPSKTDKFLGRNTRQCLVSGILYGYGAMTDGLIQRFRKKYGPLKVIATGGFSSQLKTYSRLIDVCNPRHTLQSLLQIFVDFKDKRG